MANRKLLTTGNAAINTTTSALTSDGILRAILFTASVASGQNENLVITIDAQDGAAYDAVIYNADMNGLTHAAVTDIAIPVFTGDKFVIAYTNTDTRTISVRLLIGRA